MSDSHIAASRLRSFIERIEKINEYISEHRDDRKEVFAEAKGEGYDINTLKAIIRLRKKSSDERQEEDAILETYLSALGME